MINKKASALAATNRRAVFAGLLSLIVLLSPGKPAVAGAQITISPTRIVFEGRTRSASVNLINRGNETSTFRIKFEHKRMTRDGQFELVKQPKEGELFSDQMIRYSPRQVVLPPGKSQVVRLLLRKPPNLADGEYRSHMLFSEVPKQASKTIEAQTGKSKQLSISIKPILGISIPVIVRSGSTDATVSFSSMQLAKISKDQTRAELSLVMMRSGNRSVYGDLVVKQKKRKDDKDGVVVSQINGIAVYSPNQVRTATLALQAPKGDRFNTGYLEVTYRSKPDDGDKILAQGQIALPAQK